MQNKPVILLNSDFRKGTNDAPDYCCITAGYFDAIIQAGGIPLVAPPLASEDDIVAILERVDGVVLIGGGDLDPRNDGFMVHPSMKLLNPRREEFDRRLMREIYNRRVPVFGIGAGMQLMNVVLGGNLFFNIADDLPHAIRHMDQHDTKHRHGLLLKRGSLLDRVFGDGEIRVISRHHMAIDQLASCFMVTAKCADGVIEGIESNVHDWVALGTQFHPEANGASALDVRIFEEFMDSVRVASSSMKLVA